MKEWDTFLTRQEKELGRETVDKWLRPLKIINFDACNLYLKAETSFQANWFKEHIADPQLTNQNNRKIHIHLAVANQPSTDRTRLKPKEDLPFHLTFDEISSDKTLDSLISFSGNELAVRLMGQLCSGELELASFNPIYLHGRPGSGKTHVLMAAANAFRARGLRAIYVQAERFTEHVITAIRMGQMQLFRNIYRKADVLIIDNVQVLGRRAATQEELHHTFNALHIERKQLIFAADGAPQELRFIEPRLISRFEWGIVLPLKELDRATLSHILKSRAIALKLPISRDIIPYLLNTFQSTSAVRALEALALRIHLEKHPLSETRPLTLPIAQAHLADLVQEERKAALTHEKIIGTVSSYFGIKAEDILGKSQKKEISLPRQIAMYLCRKRLTLPFVKIGDIFSRDHSTVMTSVRRIDGETQNPHSDIAPLVNAISREL